MCAAVSDSVYVVKCSCREREQHGHTNKTLRSGRNNIEFNLSGFLVMHDHNICIKYVFTSFDSMLNFYYLFFKSK